MDSNTNHHDIIGYLILGTVLYKWPWHSGLNQETLIISSKREAVHDIILFLGD